MKVVAVGNTVLFLDMINVEGFKRWVEVSKIDFDLRDDAISEAKRLDEGFNPSWKLSNQVDRKKLSDGIDKAFKDSKAKDIERFVDWLSSRGKSYETAGIKDWHDWEASKERYDFTGDKKEDRS